MGYPKWKHGLPKTCGLPLLDNFEPHTHTPFLEANGSLDPGPPAAWGPGQCKSFDPWRPPEESFGRRGTFPTEHRCHMGMGQKNNPRKTAGFSPCVHLPGFHFGYLFLTHSHKQVAKRSFTRRSLKPSIQRGIHPGILGLLLCLVLLGNYPLVG